MPCFVYVRLHPPFGRYQYKLYHDKTATRKSAMTPERIEALDRLGFCWDGQTMLWDDRYDEMVRFFETHGHANVPPNYDAAPKLFGWLKVRTGYSFSGVVCSNGLRLYDGLTFCTDFRVDKTTFERTGWSCSCSYSPNDVSTSSTNSANRILFPLHVSRISRKLDLYGTRQRDP